MPAPYLAGCMILENAIRMQDRERVSRVEKRVTAGLAASDEKAIRRWLVQLAKDMRPSS